MAIQIAVANQKGGIGKSTTALALTAGLKKRGYSVLMIDTDPQRNTTNVYKAKTENTPTLYDIIFSGYEVSDCIQKTAYGDIIAADENLQNADIRVTETASNQNTFSLKMHLRDQEGLGYMVVVFDKNPVKLNSWSVVDATENKTDVSFSNLKNKTDFGKNYFQLSRHKTVSTNGGDDFYD